MVLPIIDPADIADIKLIVSSYFIQHPRNTDGTPRQQTAFTPQESETLVNVILRELGRRGYAVAKPEKS